ncbi:MAG: UDP-glucose 4-epimerase GalE [Balneolaceae bacterium]
MSILITGATGYIGSHTTLAFLKAGYDLIALDNLTNSHPESLKRVSRMAGRSCPLHILDLRDHEALQSLFQNHSIDGVIHFAGLKSVGESMDEPLRYYDNNVSGSLNLIRVMNEYQVKRILFSSSCTVYGDPEEVPVTEDSPTGQVTSPYGRTKYMIEQILQDLQTADPEWSLILLRYFNPIGAHPDGEIGEDPAGRSGNLMPWLTQVAIGKQKCVDIYGGDYPTPDGTAIRDYIHVMDLADGHLKAWEHHRESTATGIYNLGTGHGYSVLELIHTFESVTGKNIPWRITDRRPGDVPAVWADPGKAEKILHWEAKRNLEEMCRDSWNWQVRNPNGFKQA